MAMSSGSNPENAGSNPARPANQRVVAYARLLKLHRRAITYEGYEEGLCDASISDKLANLRDLMSEAEVEQATTISQSL